MINRNLPLGAARPPSRRASANEPPRGWTWSVRRTWARSSGETGRVGAQCGDEEERERLCLVMALAAGVVGSVTRILGRKLPARRARLGFLSALREEAEASSYLHSSHSTNKVSPRFISSGKVLRNIKGIGICSLLTHPADPSLAEERLQGLIYPVADD